MARGRSKPLGERCRMIFDLPDEVQMAIRLRAVKYQLTTGDVIIEAIKAHFPKEIAEAIKAIKELSPKSRIN